MRFEPVGSGQTDLGWGGEALERAAYNAAREVYSFQVEVTIDIRAGSLRGWAKIGALGIAIYSGIANYPNFKNGLETLYRDAKDYGSMAIDEFKKLTDSIRQGDLYSQRRTKTPGKLLRSLNRLQWLVKNSSELSTAQMQEEVRRLRYQLQSALDDLPETEAETVKSLIKAHHSDELPDSIVQELFLKGPEPPSLRDLQAPMVSSAADKDKANTLLYHNVLRIEDHRISTSTSRSLVKWRPSGSEL